LFSEVPEIPVSSNESWREESTGLNPPKSFIINDAHEDKTKVFFCIILI